MGTALLARGVKRDMATPLGHSLAGYAIAQFTAPKGGHRMRGWWLLPIVMANLPDLDFLPGLLAGRPALYHHGVTHSLGFALLISLGVTGIYRLRKRPFPATFHLCFLAYLSHLLLDVLSPDGRRPYGIPLWWPLSAAYFTGPVALLLGVRHAGSSSISVWDWIRSVLHPYNLAALALETLWMAPFILWGRRYRQSRWHQQSTG